MRAADLVWVDDNWLAHAGVRPWTELPIWILPTDAGAAIYQVDVTKALRRQHDFVPTRRHRARHLGLVAPTERGRVGAAIRRDGWLTRQRETQLLDSWLVTPPARYARATKR